MQAMIITKSMRISVFLVNINRFTYSKKDFHDLQLCIYAYDECDETLMGLKICWCSDRQYDNNDKEKKSHLY